MTGRRRQEVKFRAGYMPVTWHSVAKTIAEACERRRGRMAGPVSLYCDPLFLRSQFRRLDRTRTALAACLLARIVDSAAGTSCASRCRIRVSSSGRIRRRGIRASPSYGAPGSAIPPATSCSAWRRTKASSNVFLRLRTSGPVANQPIRLLANGEKFMAGHHRAAAEGCHVARPQKRGRRRQVAAERCGRGAHRRDKGRDRGVDGRMPTIGFERPPPVPENDLKARLDVLSNLLL